MTALPTFNAGTEPTAGQLQTLLPILARRTTDSSPVNNSTTLVNDSVLFWPLTANVTYDFRIVILYTSNATANFKFAFTFPAGCRLDFGFVGLLLGGTNTVDSRAAINIASAGTVSIAGGAAPEAVHINGTLSVGGTAGNLQLQFAQNTANASNTVVNAGSSGTLRQVA